jgi:phage-related protein
VDGFAQSVGNGISGLIAGSFDVIGAALRGIVDALSRALPGGMLAAVVFVVLFVAAWQLARR